MGKREYVGVYLESWGMTVPEHMTEKDMRAALHSFVDTHKRITDGMRADINKLERLSIDIQTLSAALGFTKDHRARKRAINKKVTKKKARRKT